MRTFAKGLVVAGAFLAVVAVWTAVSFFRDRTNPQAIEYIGDTPEGWKVYRAQGTGRTSGYVAIPPAGAAK